MASGPHLENAQVEKITKRCKKFSYSKHVRSTAPCPSADPACPWRTDARRCCRDPNPWPSPSWRFLIPEVLIVVFGPGVAGPLPLLLPMTMSTDCECDFHLPSKFLVRLPSFDIDAACFHWSKNFLEPTLQKQFFVETNSAIGRYVCWFWW